MGRLIAGPFAAKTLGDFGAELERQVRQFRYPEALEILQRARSQRPELAP